MVLLNRSSLNTGPFDHVGKCGAPADGVMGMLERAAMVNPSVKMPASIAHIYGQNHRRANLSPRLRGRTLAERSLFTPRLSRPDVLPVLAPLHLPPLLRANASRGRNRLAGHDDGHRVFHFRRTVTLWEQGNRGLIHFAHCEFLLLGQQARSVAERRLLHGRKCAGGNAAFGIRAAPRSKTNDAINRRRRCAVNGSNREKYGRIHP